MPLPDEYARTVVCIIHSRATAVLIYSKYNGLCHTLGEQ